MAQVTGYTAERMAAIEAASIVNGDIDSNGHLILTRFDESQIDAGVILTSPKIVTSATRPTGADLFDGLIIYETDTKRFWSWNDTAWVYIGGVFFCTSATRPASPFAGLEIYETDTKRKYIYTGTAWSYLLGGTNPTYYRGYRNAAINAAGNSWTTIFLDGESYDYGNNATEAGGYVVPETALYAVTARIKINANNNPQRLFAALNVNGTNEAIPGQDVTIPGIVGGEGFGLLISAQHPLTAGNVVRLQVWNGQANVCVIVTGPSQTWMEIRRI